MSTSSPVKTLVMTMDALQEEVLRDTGGGHGHTRDIPCRVSYMYVVSTPFGRGPMATGMLLSHDVYVVIISARDFDPENMLSVAYSS